MAKKNQIGLDSKQSMELAEKLNILLADYQVFYINVRGFHWNISGENFFELHLKFEELYADALLKVDEIAERILTLGFTPLHSFSDYLNRSGIKEMINVSEGKQAANSIIDCLQKLLETEREILTLSADAKDEGTNAIMSDYIRQQEKLVWMYNAFLE